MATGSADSSSSSVAKKPSEQFILQQLDRTRIYVKMVDLCGGLLTLATAILVSLLALAVIDAWILNLGWFARLIALLGLIAGSAIYMARFIWPLVAHRINPVYAARVIEESKPSLKNSLINFLMVRSDSTYAAQDSGRRNKAILAAVEAKAAQDLRHVPVESAVDRSRLILFGYALVGVMTVGGLYKIMSPKDPFQTLIRIAAPLADVPPPATVKITEVEPGHADVYFGDSLAVTARIRGVGRNDSVKLVYSTNNGSLTNVEVPMIDEDGNGTYTTTLSTGDSGIQQSLKYRLEAGDAWTPEYRVNVLSRPTMIIDSLKLVYPEYTEFPAREVDGGSELTAIEGTKVFVTASANLPMSGAAIELLHPTSSSDETDESGVSDGELVVGSTIDMEVDGNTASGEFRMLLRPDRVTPKYSHFRLKFRAESGERNEAPVEYRLNVIPDLAPEVDIIEPRDREIKLPADRSVEIAVRALDPDFQISRLFIRGDQSGRLLLEHDMVAGDETRAGRVEKRYRFRPYEYGLSSGDVVVVSASAEDNRQSALSGIPDPNITNSSNLVVKIVPPVGGFDPLDGEAGDAGSEVGDDPSGGDPNTDDDMNDASATDNGSDGDAGSDANDASSNSDDETQGAQSGNADDSSTGSDDSTDSTASSNDSGGGTSNDDAASNQNDQGSQADSNTGSQSGDSSQQQSSDSSDQSNDDPMNSTGASGSQSDSSDGTGSSTTDSGQPGAGQSDPGSSSTGQSTQQSGSDGQGSQTTDSSDGSSGGTSATGDGSTTDGTPTDQSGDAGSQASDGSGASESSDGTPADLHDGEAFERIKELIDQMNAEGGGQSSTNDNSGGSAGQENSGGSPSDSSGSGGDQSSDSNSGNASSNQGTSNQGTSNQGTDASGGQTGDQGSTGGGSDSTGGDSTGDDSSGGGASGSDTGSSQSESGSGGASDDSSSGQDSSGGQTGGGDQGDMSGGGGSEETGGGGGDEQESASGGDDSESSGGGGSEEQQTGGSQGGENSGGGQDENQTGDQGSGGESSDSGGGGTDEESGGGGSDMSDGNQQSSGGGDPMGANESSGGSETQNAGDSSGASGQASTSGNQSSNAPAGGDSGAGANQEGNSPGNGVSGDESAGDSNQATDSDASGSNPQGDGNQGQGDGNRGQGTGQNGTGDANQGRSDPNSADRANENNSQDDDSSNADSNRSNQQDGSSRPNQESNRGSDNQNSDGSSSGGNGNSSNGNSDRSNPGNDSESSGGGQRPRLGNESGSDSRTPVDPLSGGEVPDGEKPNLEYAKEATDLVLEYLEQQKDNPDERILEELDWSKEELADFLDRWQRMKQQANGGDAADRQAWEDSLRSLGLRPGADRRVRTEFNQDDIQQLQQDGSRTEPPAEFAESYRAFQRGTSRDESQSEDR